MSTGTDPECMKREPYSIPNGTWDSGGEVWSVPHFSYPDNRGMTKRDFICEYVLTREGDPMLIVQEAEKVWNQIMEVCGE